MKIEAEMEAFNKTRQEAQQASASSARVDLDEAHRQSLPVGVMDNDEFEDMPPLIKLEEGEEEFEDDPELVPADEGETTKAPGIPRRHKETIDYNENIDRWKNKDVSAERCFSGRYSISVTFKRNTTNRRTRSRDGKP